MTRDELMQMAAEKAVKELDWKSIEWLFKPRDCLELLIRLNPELAKKMSEAFYSDEKPNPVASNMRNGYRDLTDSAFKAEEFYRTLKEIHDAGGAEEKDSMEKAGAGEG